MLVRPENKSVVLSNVVGSFSAGEFRADRIELKNWEDVINTLDARISSQFDLAQLSRELVRGGRRAVIADGWSCRNSC